MKKALIFISLFSLILCSLCFSDDKTIFVVESYHTEYPWDISYKKGIESILGKDYTLVYFQMDTKRLPVEQFEHRAQLAFEMYKKINPILVMLGDDNALKFLGPKFSKTKTPVVYFGINNNPRDYNVTHYDNITGVLERPLSIPSIVYLNDIIEPKLEKLLILFDSGISSKAAIQVMFSDRTSVKLANIQIDLKLIGDFSEWKKTISDAQKNGYGAVILGLYHTIVDENKKHVSHNQVIEWTSINTPVPSFGFWDFSVGADKMIGGRVTTGFSQGEEAAKMAKEILGGKKISQISPVMEKKNRFLFSRSQLKKWKITLPENISSKADFIE
ncbi:MAG: ABC transporter substrate binding protein [Pseudomonadota bacterium]